MKTNLIITLISIIIISVVCLFIARSCDHIVNPPAASQGVRATVPARTPDNSVPVTTSYKLISSSNPSLDLTIPPNKDTLKFRITDQVVIARDSVSKQSQISVIKRTSIIRYHPTLHFTVLIPPDIFSAGSATSAVNLGLKCRVLEIWRFGTCAYLTTSGIGAGIDFKLISNLSLDYAQLLTFKSLTFKPYLGLSLKL
jgi:hypothetical protein